MYMSRKSTAVYDSLVKFLAFLKKLIIAFCCHYVQCLMTGSVVLIR